MKITVLEDRTRKEWKIWSGQRFLKVNRKTFKYLRRQRSENPTEMIKQGTTILAGLSTSRRQGQVLSHVGKLFLTVST